MDAGCPVGSEAVAEFDPAQQEVLFELGPFLGCDVAVFVAVGQGAAVCDELLVMPDDVLGEDGGVAAGGVEIEVAE
ncbi:hypothetical protein ACQP2U_22325 [Nocardia sp. CA-084685]|uniref:hypothetical protein n=1 Tax=Nocardia sp. CA-084685 TaxID=3239970 RepID=UPI003D95F04A